MIRCVVRKGTYPILVKRDAAFSTIADGANTPVTSIGGETDWTEDVLVRA